MKGLGLGLNKKTKIRGLPNRADAVQYLDKVSDGIIQDRIGSWSPEYRQSGAYWDGDGTAYIDFGATYANEDITYLNKATQLEVNTTLDANGHFGPDVVQVEWLTIDGHTFTFEQPTANTVVQSIPPAGEAPISGDITLGDGTQIVHDDRIEQTFNKRGGAIAKALGNQLFNVNDYIDGYYLTSLGVRTSSASFYISGKKYVKGFSAISFTSIATGGAYTCFYDQNGDFISSDNSTATNLAVPSNAYYVDVSVRKTTTPDPNDYMMNEGATLLTYEAWQGYYYDDSETNPVPDGTPLTNDTAGYINAYLADGIRPRGELQGKVRCDKEYNYGNFDANGTDNYLDTGIVPTQSTVMKVWGKFNQLGVTRVFGVTGSPNEYLFGAVNDDLWRVWAGSQSMAGTTSADTDDHVFEWNDAELFVDGVKVAGTKGTSIGTPTNSIWLMGAYNTLYADFTIYKAEIIHSGSTYVWDFNPNNDEAVVCTIDGVVQAAPTIQGTVTSPQWETEGYMRSYEQPAIYRESQADTLTANKSFDHTDPTALVAKVVPVTDYTGTPNDSDVRFSKIEDSTVTQQALYDEAQTGTILTRIKNLFGIS